MSFQSSSEFNNKAPGSYNPGQQYYINPQPSVGRFPTEVPTFCIKGSTGRTSIIPGIAKSMALVQSNQGYFQDQAQTENSTTSSSGNQHRFHGTGAKLFNALPKKTNYK